MKIRDFSLIKLGALLFTTWILMLLFVWHPLSLFAESDNNDEIQKRLTGAFAELRDLKQENLHMKSVLAEINNGLDGGILTEDLLARLKSKLDRAARGVHLKTEENGENNLWVPSTEYEMKRRLVNKGVMEWWYLISSELRKLNKALESSAPSLTSAVSSLLENSAQHQRALVWDLEDLSNMDHLKEWRAKESEDLSLLVQNRIHQLQNPRNCSSAKKLVCNLNKSCGYGCQVHHAAYCFIVAYSTQRTLILQSKNWRYNKGGWEKVFKPLSDSCLDAGGTRVHWPGSEDSQVVELPIIDMLSPRPPHLPLAIPKDIAPRLMRLHGNPSVWWISQFIQYLLRYQPETQDMLDSTGRKLQFEKPIVGVHIRRTDKVGTEAAFHSLEEYMKSVKEYYDMIEFKQGITKRRVYLASDDPSVHNEAKQKYPTYEFIGDNNIAKDAAVATRYSDKSLRGVIIDIHFLAHSDFLVCTFSSQVCRLAYEIMQGFYPDAAERFKSLDDLYYYGGQSAHKQRVIYPHVPAKSDELELKVGDVVGIAGNHWDGYSKGTNERTKKNGLYPSFKAVDIIDQVDFPVYDRT